MMLKFVQIPSLEKLCSLIENSSGNVFLQQSDEMFIDMKQNHCLPKELQNTLEQDKNIRLHIFNQKDFLNFVNYMVGTAYDETACI